MGFLDSLKRKSNVYDEMEETEELQEPSYAQPAAASRPAVRAVTQEKPAAPIGALRMQVLRPTEFGEATKVADYLKAGQAVVLNLENMDDDEARRMIDYVAGVLYAVEGKIERPAQRTFLLTPTGVSVASEDVARMHPEI